MEKKLLQVGGPTKFHIAWLGEDQLGSPIFKIIVRYLTFIVPSPPVSSSSESHRFLSEELQVAYL